MIDVKRNSNDGIVGSIEGVGARHRQSGTADRRGGYQQICNSEMFSKKIAPTSDSRINELREIGIASYWIDIAETIGVDNFLAMWSILSDSDTVQLEKHYAYVPRYSAWTRYQRNRAIISMHADGLSPKEIKIRIKNDLKEDITLGHINKIISK